jgi:hypothetical protein
MCRDEVEVRGNHIAQKRTLAGRSHCSHTYTIVVVDVGDVEVRALNVPTNLPSGRAEDIRDRELRATLVVEVVALVGNRQNHQRRDQLKRNVIEEQRCVGVIGGPAIELQRVLTRRQNQLIDASISDITASDRLFGIDDLVVKQHRVVHRGGSPVATVLAFPGKLDAA